MKPYFSFLLVFAFLCVSYTIKAQKTYSRPVSNDENFYGIKDANRNWILTPRYKSIGKFYDYDFEDVRDYAIFEEIKKVDGKEFRRTGLLNNKGEIVIPSNYYFLSCDKNLCLAFENNDGGSKIIDFKNKIVEENPNTIFGLKDSIILYKKEKEQYFKKIGSNKSFGPFTRLDFDRKEKLIYAEDGNSKKIINYNGEVIVNDPDLSSLLWEGRYLFGENVYIKKKDSKYYFANTTNSKTFGNYEQLKLNIDHKSINVCLKMQYGCQTSCTASEDYSIFYIQKILSSDSEYIEKGDKIFVKKQNKVALVNDEGKIISKFYDYNQSAFKNDFNIFEIKDGKKEFRILDYTGKEIFTSQYMIVNYDKNFQLLFDSDNNKYFTNFYNKLVEIKNETNKPFNFYNNEISYNSDIYKLYDDKSNRFFINRKGKIFKNKVATNFYNNRAFTIIKNKLYIINDKFKKIGKVEGKFDFISDIDENGIAEFSNSDNYASNYYGLVNIITGKVITNEYYERTDKVKNVFYFLRKHIYPTENTQSYINVVIDKTGKELHRFQYYKGDMKYTENYIFVLVPGEGYYFYDNQGVFIGKDVLRYNFRN